MKRASVRNLRYRLAEVERSLLRGEALEITKRREVIARLLPARASAQQQPDFLMRLRRIYGNRTLAVSGAQLLAQERDRF